MTRKAVQLMAKSKDPFTHQYNQSEYIVLTSAVRRDSTSGRLIIKEPEKKVKGSAQKRNE